MRGNHSQARSTQQLSFQCVKVRLVGMELQYSLHMFTLLLLAAWLSCPNVPSERRLRQMMIRDLLSTFNRSFCFLSLHERPLTFKSHAQHASLQIQHCRQPPRSIHPAARCLLRLCARPQRCYRFSQGDCRVCACTLRYNLISSLTLVLSLRTLSSSSPQRIIA